MTLVSSGDHTGQVSHAVRDVTRDATPPRVTSSIQSGRVAVTGSYRLTARRRPSCDRAAPKSNAAAPIHPRGEPPRSNQPSSDAADARYASTPVGDTENMARRIAGLLDTRWASGTG